MTASPSSPSAAPRADEVLPGVFQIACPFGEGGIVYVYYLDGAEPARRASTSAAPAGAAFVNAAASGAWPSGVMRASVSSSTQYVCRWNGYVGSVATPDVVADGTGFCASQSISRPAM